MISYLLTILIGIGAGLFAGMFGIGGGIVIIPAIMLAYGWVFKEATATSLAALLMPTNFTALKLYKQSNLLYIKGSAFIAVGMLVGSYVGASLALFSFAGILKILFGIYQGIVGIKYARPIYTFNRLFRPQLIKEVIEDYKEPNTIKPIIYILLGVAAGILAGMFGIGGGLIITTALIGWYKIAPKQSIAISLAAMFLPVGILGVLQHNAANNIHWVDAILIAVGIEVGSALSSKVAIKLKTPILKQLFGVALILVGIYFVLEEFL